MLVITCPQCSTRLKLASALPPGAHIRCPKCSVTFACAAAPQPASAYQSAPPPPPAPAIRSAPPPAPAPARQRYDDYPEDDEDDRPVRRKRKKRKKSGNLALVLILSIGGGLLAIGGIVLLFLLLRSGGGDNYSRHEALAKEAIGILEDLESILKGVRDPNSARDAAPRLHAICDRIEDVDRREKALPKLTAAEESRLRKQFEPQIQAINQRMQQIAFQAGVNSRAEASFMNAAQRLANIEQKLGRNR